MPAYTACLHTLPAHTACMPCRSRKNLCWSLDLPRDSLSRALRLLITGHTRPNDMNQLPSRYATPQRMLCQCLRTSCLDAAITWAHNCPVTPSLRLHSSFTIMDTRAHRRCCWPDHSSLLGCPRFKVVRVHLKSGIPAGSAVMTWLRQHKTGTQMAFIRAYSSSSYQLAVFPPQLHTFLVGSFFESPMGPQSYPFHRDTVALETRYMKTNHRF